MMMSAMRRPGSSMSRAKSAKRRSARKASSREEDVERERSRAASRLAELSEVYSGRVSRADAAHKTFPRPASRTSQEASPKHGADVADSGIDSGNGVTEPDHPEIRRNSSSDRTDAAAAEAEERVASPRSALPDSDHHAASSDSCAGGEDAPVTGHDPAARSSLPDKDDHTASSSGYVGEENAAVPRQDPAVTVTVTDHSHAESSPAPPRKRNKSKRRKDKHAKSEEDSSHFSTIASGINSHGDKPLGRDTSDDNNYAETDDGNDKETSDDDAAARSPRVAKPKSESEEEEEEEEEDDDESSVLKLATDETEDNGRGDTGLSPNAKERRHKLKARLEQAKQSLESPHINNAVDAFEMAEGPLVSPPNTGLLQEFRSLFQHELTRLRTELDTFRSFCAQQMEHEAERISAERSKPDSEDPEVQRRKEAELKNLAVKEESLQKREDLLANRVKDLQEYEQEILEVENMLNQRQAICERRQNALLALDEELQSLREDIFDKKDNIKEDSDTSAERARKNWDFVRRNLTDKQAMMEATIQRYRTQIAAANASLAGKDSLVAHLQKQIKEAQDSVKTKDRKLEQLEDKLVLATEEIHRQSKNNSANTSVVDPHSRPQSRSGSVRPQSSMQRQRSESPTSAMPEPRSLSRARSVPASGRRMSVHPDSSLVPTAGRRKSTTGHHPDIATMITSNRKSSGAGGEPVSNGVHEQRAQGKRSSAGHVSGVDSRPGSVRRRHTPMSRSQSIAHSVANASTACTIL